MRILRTFAALAALLAASACDSPTSSVPSESAVNFEYRLGDGTWRTFTSSGNQPAGADLTVRGEWVYAIADGPRTNALAVGQQRITGDTWVDFWVLIPMTERGDVIDLRPTDAGPCAEGRRCTYMQVIVNPTSAAGTVRELCEITSGEMVLRRVNVEVVSASFSGTGTCEGGPAARPFQVRNGSMDVVLPPVQEID